MTLTLPDDQSLLIRTDFTDDAAWLETVQAARQPWDLGGGIEAFADLTLIDDRAFDGLTLDGLMKIIGAGPPYYVFIADSRTLSDPEHPILAVDTGNEDPDRDGVPTLRVVPSEMAAIENNLSLANMDFEDFASSADEDGVFRGF